MRTGVANRGSMRVLTFADRLLAITVAGSVVTFVAAAVGHSAGYFFLFDDYAIVGAALKTPLGRLAAEPLFGFFRPAVMLVMRLEARLFSFTSPWGWAATSMLLHAANTFLLGALLVRCSIPFRAAGCAATLFLLSPWAGEAFFWTGAQFDLLSTAFLLLGLLVAAPFLEGGDGHSNVVRISTAALCLEAALLSKETAAPLPAIAAIPAFLGSLSRKKILRGLALAVLGAVALLVYLFLRSRTMSMFEGPYGQLRDLVKGSSLIRNFLAQLRGVVMPPMPALLGLERPLRIAFAVAAIAAGVIAFIRRPIAAIATGLAFGCLLLPTIWIRFGTTTAGGRYLYIPGLCATILVALAVAPGEAGAFSERLRLPASFLAAALLVLGAASLIHQRALWSSAASVARQAIEQFRPLAGTQTPVHVTNLPAAMAEGPPILKSYAFRLYYGVDRPLVRATLVTISLHDGSRRLVPAGPDPFSEYAARNDELSITLPINTEIPP